MDQTSPAALRRKLREALVEAAGQAGAGGFGSVLFRAAAALYALLLVHAVDQRGRCRSCRRPESRVGPQRRRCRIYPVAQFWLHQPSTALPTGLTRDLELPPPPRPGTRTGRPGLTVNRRTQPGRHRAEPADIADTDDDTDPAPPIRATPPSAPIRHQAPVVSACRWPVRRVRCPG